MIKYKFAKSIATASANCINTIARKNGFFDSRFITNWADIVGSEIALMCTPASIKYDEYTKMATVFLHSSSPHFKAMFTYYKQDILTRIIKYFGVSFISDIRIIKK